MDVYHKLREKLSSHPAGAPERPEIFEILRILFTPEEAGLAIHLAFTAKPVGDIAQKAGLSVEDVIALCEQLADKGLVLSRSRGDKKAYGLLPLMPGIFEFPFMKTRYLDLDFGRLAQLWHQYYDGGWGREFHSGETSMSRIIPVRKAIPSTSVVLPFEEVSGYIDKAGCISVGDCACRVAAKRCSNPIEVCLGLDGFAEFLVERKMGRFITKEEALKILEETEEVGLVHLTSNTSERIGFICSCCSCCCVALGVATRVKDAASHPVSNFYASVNVDDCNACGVCEDRCPAKAVTVGDVAVIDVPLCIGCGLCASACPTEAIDLIRKSDSIQPPAGTKELALKVAEERGRVDAFLANLT
jgi:electron transport complex protein RnfB